MQLELFTPAQALTVFRAQIQDRLEDFQEDTKQAVDQGHFEQAQTLLQQAQALKDLLTDLDAWAKRFATLVGPIVEGDADGGGDEETPRLVTLHAIMYQGFTPMMYQEFTAIMYHPFTPMMYQ